MTDQTNPEDIKKVEIEKRRVKVLLVKDADFLSFFTKGGVIRKHLKVLEGVPEDAIIVGIGQNPIFPGIMLVVKSDEYDEVPVNENPPIQPITIDLGRNVSTAKAKNKKKK